LGIQIEGSRKYPRGSHEQWPEAARRHHINDAIARYGLTVGEVQEVINQRSGMNITRTIEDAALPVNVRYPRELRDDVETQAHPGAGENGRRTENGVERCREPRDGAIPLIQLADIHVTTAAMIRDEDAMLARYVFIDVTGRDIGGYGGQAGDPGKPEAAGRIFSVLGGVGSARPRNGCAAGRVLGGHPPVVHDVHSISESLILMIAVLYAMTGSNPAVYPELQFQWRSGSATSPLRNRRANRR
jgi:hypothetical protein